MDIKIDSKGILNIERAGTWKQMKCCKGTFEFCNDNCPLFEEPKKINDVQKEHSFDDQRIYNDAECLYFVNCHDIETDSIGIYELKICNKKFQTEGLLDERNLNSKWTIDLVNFQEQNKKFNEKYKYLYDMVKENEKTEKKHDDGELGREKTLAKDGFWKTFFS